jgi:hypothetical protein
MQGVYSPRSPFLVKLGRNLLDSRPKTCADRRIAIRDHRNRTDGEDSAAMVRYTCDVCGRELPGGEDQHFVVKIEAYAVQDPAELTEADLEADHLEAVGQLLRDVEEHGSALDLPEPTRHFRYDLCPECHRRFVRDPLGKDQPAKVSFSEN